MIKNIFIGIVALLAFIGAGFGVASYSQIQPLLKSAETAIVKLGSTVEINPYWYSGGLAWGRVDVLHDTQQLVLQQGMNQVTWFPAKSGDIVIDQIDLSMNGTASSSFQVNLGTTTTANNIADVFSNVTKPFWAQAIDSFQVATGSTAQVGASADFLTTMGTSNKTNYPDELQVVPGGGVRLMVNSFCINDGACNNATSTNRGWTTMTATLFYHYRGPD